MANACHPRGFSGADEGHDIRWGCQGGAGGPRRLSV